MNFGIISGLDRGDPPEIQPPPPAFPSFSALGDSITSLAGARSNFDTINAGGWPGWASGLAGGEILVASVYGEASKTSQEIRTRVLPLFLNDVRSGRGIKPGYCVVLAGTNDPGAISFESTKQALEAIWKAIKDEGIIPILCTLTPRTGANGTGYQKINSFIRLYGAANRLRVVDFATAPTLTDNSTGAWITGLSGDGLHPNGAGAKAMGAVLAAYFRKWDMCGWIPPLTQANADANNLYGTNGLMINYSATAPYGDVPTGFSMSGTGASISLAPATSPALGNTATLTKGSGDLAFFFPSITWAANNVVAFAMRAEVTVAGVSPQITLAMLYGGIPFAWTGIDQDMPAGSVFTGICRFGTGASLGGRVIITGGTGTIVKVSQITAVNLTALGIVS